MKNINQKDEEYNKVILNLNKTINQHILDIEKLQNINSEYENYFNEIKNNENNQVFYYILQLNQINSLKISINDKEKENNELYNRLILLCKSYRVILFYLVN